MNIEPIVQRAAILARDTTLSLTTLAGAGCAERVLTALVLAYAEQLADVAGRPKAGEILYACADQIATGDRT